MRGDIPSMRNTDDMIHVAQRKLEQLIRENTRRIRKPKETVIRKHGP